jgi:hypothetical protein
MTDDSHNLRHPATRPARGSAPSHDQATTIRTTPVDLEADALPDQASQYVAPQPVPRVSEHKTLDMVPVRLAPEVNPRHALTQRLSPVPPQRQRRGLWLALLLAAAVLVIGVLALRRSSAPPSPAAGAASAVVPPLVTATAPLPEEPALPAAATLSVPAIVSEQSKPVVQSSPTEARKTPLTPAVEPARAAPSAAPVQPSKPKGRDLWLE